MYLRSKLKGENVTLYEIDVKDKPTADSEIHFKEISYTKNNSINVGGKLYYTDGFFIVNTIFDANDSYTEILNKRGDYIQISLLLTGRVSTFKDWIKKVRDIDPGLLQLVYRGDTDVEMEMPGQGKLMKYIRIFISRDFYLALVENENWISKSIFYKDVQQKKHVHFGRNLIPVTATILEIYNDILNNKHEGILKKYFIEQKLKSLFLELFIINAYGKNIPTITDTVLEKLEKAKAYLATNYFNPPTIKQLSRIISLNELKLKNGFKENFNCTIHDYIIKVRMKNAKRMLFENLSVNEIAAQVGYKSVPHFITAFKKYYGVTPKKAIMDKSCNSAIVKINSIFYFFAFEAITDMLLFV